VRDPAAVRLAVFDLGGTLIHDTADVAAIFKAALARHGLEVHDRQLVAWRGASKREVIAHLTAGSRAEPERIYATFQDLLVAAFAENGVRGIEGAEQALERLAQRGLRVALTTGFDRKITAGLLAQLPWRGRIDAVVSADEVAVGRPAPYMIFRAMEQTRVQDVHEVLNVGDTDNDLLAGHYAGVGANVGVLSGAHDRARLEKAPHSALLASVAEVPPWLERHAAAEKKKARR
jgi:phosphoglycolate phosphatase